MYLLGGISDKKNIQAESDTKAREIVKGSNKNVQVLYVRQGTYVLNAATGKKSFIILKDYFPTKATIIESSINMEQLNYLYYNRNNIALSVLIILIIAMLFFIKRRLFRQRKA